MTETAKPFLYLLMWRNGEMNMCTELEADEWQIISHRPEQYRIYDINGQKAHVFIATEDNDINRQEAVKLATSFIFGRLVTRYVALDLLETHDEPSKPHFHPPN